MRNDTARGGGLARDLSAAEAEAAEPDVSRLAELLAWAEHTRVGLLVEVKEPDATHAVGAMVAASAARGRIVIGGFHGPLLAPLKTALPGVRTSFIISSAIAAPKRIAPPTRS